jgi:hypothetical protein
VILKSFKKREILQGRLKISSWAYHPQEKQVEDKVLIQVLQIIAPQLLQLVESMEVLEVRI